jgi:hypothetical protein
VTGLPAAALALPLLGRGVELEPGFEYYHDRSRDSVAIELGTHGYRVVHYILTVDSSVDPAYIEAFHRQGIGIWYTTFANGTYSTDDLPEGWESWLMVMRSTLSGTPLDDGYWRLCLNNPGYRAWKKKTTGEMLRKYAFDGVSLVEPHWPEYPGRTNPAYACFCPHCLAGFKKMFPEANGFPDILDAASPDSPEKNSKLWRKWCRFRTASLTDFLDDLVNGKGGLRAAGPGKKICVWTLALDEPNGVQRVMDDSGEDPGEITRVVKPDVYCLQTHWPDWVKPDLAPDYVKAYQPFIDAIRAAAPNMPLMIQADTGSNKGNRRSWAWIEAFEKACHALGVGSTTFYEYAIGLYIYQDPPRIAEASWQGSGIRLLFDKRPAADSAGDRGKYSLSVGRVAAVTVDGTVVTLAIEGVKPGVPVTLRVKGIADDPDRRIYDDFPACVLAEQAVAIRD